MNIDALSLNPNVNQRKASNPDASVWVAASAGSGKTKVLSDRVLNLLLGGAKPEKILCLTFTKAAATQMANRIAGRLSKWAMMPETELKSELEDLQGLPPAKEKINKARRLFAEVLDTAGGMKILTIHSFCQQLLKRFPLEAGVAPNFEVMDERDAKLILESIMQSSIRSAALQKDVETVSEYIEGDSFREMFKNVDAGRGKINRAIKDLGSVEKLIDTLYHKMEITPSLTGEEVNQCIKKVNQGIKIAAEILSTGGKTDIERAEKIFAFLSATDKQKDALLDEYISAFINKSDGLITKKLTCKNTAAAEDIMREEAERIFALVQKRKAITIGKLNAALIRICAFILKEYEKRKAYLGLLDYSDLILKTRGLLESSAGVEWVLYKLDGGIDHILVDEAQDTSPEQWAIVRALAGEFFAGVGARNTKRTVFAVGDKKQSIFSFQGADPEEFAANKEYFSQKLKGIGEELIEVPLEISFRSSDAILNLVNLVLDNSSARVGVVEKEEKITHLPYRKGSAGRVEIWEPVLKEENDETSAISLPPVERVFKDTSQSRLARMIAGKISSMIEGKELLESEGRPIKPGDIMVLVRKRNIFFEELVRALKTLKIPVTGVDRMMLTEQLAVMDLLALGDFLLLPEDDLTLATVLKSPLFGFDDDDLFAIAYQRGERSLWEALRLKAADEEGKYREALERLLPLLDKADKVTPFALYSLVTDAFGGRKALLSRFGYDAEDAVDEFMNLTLAFTKTNIPSLQNFLSWIKNGDIEIKRDLEQGDINAVRITTVHSSKGLEAPIIFLPDTLSVISNKNHLFWIDAGENLKLPLWLPKKEITPENLLAYKEGAKENALKEYRRLLYVAITRPRDRLYICGWKNSDKKTDEDKEPPENWYNLIFDSLQTPKAKALLNVEVQTGIGAVTVLKSLQEAPVKRQEISVESAAEEIPVWALRVPESEPVPPRPLAPSKMDEEDSEPSAPSPIAPEREKAMRRGNVIHRLLQILPELENEKRSGVAEKYLAQPAWNLQSQEQKEILKLVFNILDNPDFSALFAKGSKAEVPIAGMLENKVFSGQVDRLAVKENEVLIIDYKTNQKPPSSAENVPEAYRRQMNIYKQLLQKVFAGKKIRGLLLWTENMMLTEI